MSSNVRLAPRWHELILFMTSTPDVRVGHVLPGPHPEVSQMREMFGNRYCPMVVGQSLTGWAFDEVWFDVALGWDDVEWAATNLLTRLRPR